MNPNIRGVAGDNVARNQSNTSKFVDDDQDYQEDQEYQEGQEGESDNRVLGGYKAAIKNPNVSKQAKQHAHEVLDSAGTDENTPASAQSSSVDDQNKDTTRVLAGYKATLNNPRVSDEAKTHAQEVLENHGAI